MRHLILLVLLLITTTAHAAYLDQGEILRYEQDANGAARLIVRFMGNAEEPIVDRSYAVTGAVSGAAAFTALKDWIHTVSNELNIARAAGTAQQVAPNSIINGQAAPAPIPSAKSAWRAKVQIFGQVCGNGFTGTIATDCAALQTDIQTSYQAGFLSAN